MPKNAKYSTKQRQILQDYLSQHIDCELSAKTVAAHLESKDLSLSAIYRNLAQLQKEGLIVQCQKAGSRELFFRYIDHPNCSVCLHLTCKVCNKIEHLSPEQSADINRQIASQSSYIIDLPSTVIYGTCKLCQAK